MKKAFTTIAVIVALSSLAPGQTNTTTSATRTDNAAPPTARTDTGDEQILLKIEEQFRTAKIGNDAATLARLLDDNFLEINQYGQNVDKAALVELFKTFKQSLLTVENLKVRLAGDNAVVTGTQIEEAGVGKRHLLFMHTYAKRQGEWKLLAVQQFLDPKEGTITPTGWNGGSNLYFLVGTDTNVKRGGNASAFFKAKSIENNSQSRGSLTQVIRADNYLGKRVRLSGYVKGENMGGRVFPWMRVDGADGEVLSFDNLGSHLDLMPEWERFEMVLDVPEKSQAIYLGFVTNGKVRAWLDDWQFEVVGKDVPSTNRVLSEKAVKEMEEYNAKNKEQIVQRLQSLKQRLPTLPAAPVNLGFESPGQDVTQR